MSLVQGFIEATQKNVYKSGIPLKILVKYLYLSIFLGGTKTQSSQSSHPTFRWLSADCSRRVSEGFP